MRIFVSYASERRSVADAIAVGLQQDGHVVFFDRDDLPSGEGYHTRIREEAFKSDLFIFLVSPESVEDGAYTLTELGFAREKWPSPSGHVLPVIVAPTELDRIPAYLRLVTFVQREGDLVAEVLARVARMSKRPRWGRWAIAAGALAAAAAGGKVAFDKPHAQPDKCHLRAVVRTTGADALPPGMVLDVSHAGNTSSYALGDRGSIAIDVGPLDGADAWTVGLRAADGSVAGPGDVRGCPESETSVRVGRDFEVALARH
jgi:hypothetical protein